MKYVAGTAAFFVHLYAPNDQRNAILRNILKSFGPILVMEARGWEAGGEVSVSLLF